jgi:hypothetical protein
MLSFRPPAIQVPEEMSPKAHSRGRRRGIGAAFAWNPPILEKQ